MKNIVILTGAGMSAESGIATFRDSGGLWEQYKIEDVATPEGFRKNPKLVLDFYNQWRRQVFEAQPNPAHLCLVELEDDYDVHIITQNVDNLHERAGSKNVLHVHGELIKARSSINPAEIINLNPNDSDINWGDKSEDGSQLRPHIVWFGEPVPKMEEAELIVQKADVLVVIGTSLNVYPAASLVYSASNEIPIYLIDPNDIVVSRSNVHIIKKGASEGVEDLLKMLKR